MERYSYDRNQTEAYARAFNMTIESKKNLLEDLKQTLSNDQDKSLIDAYAGNLKYEDLERRFREQLIEEAGGGDEI